MYRPSKHVYRDISISLRRLLLNNIPELKENTVSFKSPGEFDPPETESLSLCRIESKVNPHMRNLPAEPVQEGSNIYRKSPMVFDATYMLTPYSPDPIKEMELYEQVLSVFYDFSVLEGELLEQALIDEGNDEIEIHYVECTTQDIHNLWSIFPNKSFKQSLFYQLTPIMIMSGIETEEKLVEEKDVTYKKMNYNN